MCLPSLNSKDITKIFKIFTVSNLIFCKFFLFYAIYRFISTSNLAVFSYHELVSILDLNAIYVSVYFALNLIYIIQKSKKSRFDIWVAIVFLGFIILLSSKTIIACLLILLIIYSFLRSGFKKLFKKNIIVFIISSLIFLLISQHVVSRFISEGNSNIEEVLAMKDTNHTYPWTGTTIRLLQLRFLHNQIQEDNIFITGFGLFASRENLSNRHKSFGTYPGYHSYNYHNMYAQILSETGVLGFSILFGILLLNIVLSIQRKSYLFLSFSIIMTVWFLTESVLWVQRGLFFFIIIHCIFNKLQNYNSDWKTEN
ncbi:O-antigen ligase family protein [Seonamhaeicola sp. ML3]|uniref:O-antigen ligase family protein n=1 Tax=Seonamhaeicola sp. ML3 TaxID=2937786 RepID=UPI00200D142C|nr:O-antigen ligase family protein [Seonamhaeicola sp. ML3]